MVVEVSGSTWIETNMAVAARDLFKLERGIPSHPSLKEEKVYVFLKK